MKSKAIFCWSGGKDSAYCLHKVLSGSEYEVKYLLTTINEEFKRISMHGVREELLDMQATSVGIPLLKVRVREGTNTEYEKKMEEVLLQAKSQGIENVIFGDIFLEDLRKYREDNLSKVGMKAVFPIWNINTTEMIKDFISKKFKTVLCCTNDVYLGGDWAGTEIDDSFLSKLPSDVDPCGENGEYHTFCFDGPLFKQKIDFKRGEKVFKPLQVKVADTDNRFRPTKGFWFCDLLPIHG
jgi:uncharacterized protein (TIGR00290 family)